METRACLCVVGFSKIEVRFELWERFFASRVSRVEKGDPWEGINICSSGALYFITPYTSERPKLQEEKTYVLPAVEQSCRKQGTNIVYVLSEFRKSNWQSSHVRDPSPRVFPKEEKSVSQNAYEYSFSPLDLFTVLPHISFLTKTSGPTYFLSAAAACTYQKPSKRDLMCCMCLGN
jgi:hypothetical protein